MSKTRRLQILAVAFLAGWTAFGRRASGQAPAMQRVAAGQMALSPGVTDSAALATLDAWDARISAMKQTGELRAIRTESDTFVGGRRHERLAQYHQGVRVFGGEMVRQTNFFGQAVSVFGAYFSNVDVDVTPATSGAVAPKLLTAAGHGVLQPGTTAELLVLPMGDGSFRLTWSGRTVQAARITHVFVDAANGREVFSYNDTWSQTALPGSVGTGMGVIGDPLKIQSVHQSGTYLAIDLNRGPGQDTVYDVKGNFSRMDSILDSGVTSFSDVASSSNNVWTNSVVASAAAYIGYTYDFYRQVFNRRSLDGNDITMRGFVNPALPQNALNPGGADPNYFNNAFYAGGGYAVYGVGQVTGGVVQTRNFAAALDVVSHEMSHGVTQYTSNLIYMNESGALNEAFSDMMGVAVEFRFQALGNGPGKADWLLGEDILPSGGSIRSLSDPESNGDPDHYSLRYTGAADNGGIHTNCTIIDYAYYLATMGGVDRVSRLAVQGVGFANKEQIQRVIFRAFTLLMPANSTFSTCRAATIQAARDLYGIGSPAEVAITQAWNAVGVE